MIPKSGQTWRICPEMPAKMHVASVNTGAGSQICMKQFSVSHTRFLVSSGACGLMVLVTYEFLVFSIHVWICV